MKRGAPSNDDPMEIGEDGMSDQTAFCFSGTTRAGCLSREILQMPMHDREQITRDLFGIAQVSHEVDPEAMDEFWLELDKLTDKPAYDLALELSPEVARNHALALAFLRSVEGAPKRAAKRFAKHFQTKLDLFGKEKLVKVIELEDFDEDDMEALYSGGFQVLPVKDRAGRPILFGRYTCMKYKEVKNMLRVMWYCLSSMVEDETCQKTGTIALGYEIGRLPLERFDIVKSSIFDMNSADGGFDRVFARGALNLPASLPVRFTGYHICGDSTQWQGIADMVMVTLCKFVRLRFRYHHGTHQECQYALMTHGIPKDSIPVTLEGDIVLTHHIEWIAQRRNLEANRRAVV